MSALSKLITKAIATVIKNTTKFEIAADDLLAKFEDSCPPKDELLAIVKQKNTIQSALTQVVGAFDKVQTTVDITSAIVTTVGVVVKVIKLIPLPTSFPPGVGIPVNIITILSDSLDVLGKLVESAKGSLKIVPSAAKTIVSAAQRVLDKLAQIDGVLNVCLEELLNSENLLFDPEKEYGAGEVVTFGNNSGAGSGFCSLGPQYTTQVDCEAAGGVWTSLGNDGNGGLGAGEGAGGTGAGAGGTGAGGTGAGGTGAGGNGEGAGGTGAGAGGTGGGAAGNIGLGIGAGGGDGGIGDGSGGTGGLNTTNTGVSYFKVVSSGSLKGVPPLPPTTPPSWAPSTLDEARNSLALEIGNIAAQGGLNTDVAINKAANEIALERLSPNSIDPLLYEKPNTTNTADWRLTIEENQSNDFIFPQRRIKAENINTNSNNPFKGITVFNLFGQKYSYSLSVQVLIEEIKFVINQLDVDWYAVNNIDGALTPESGSSSAFQNANSAYGFIDTDNPTTGSTNITGSTTSNGNFIPIQIVENDVNIGNDTTAKIAIPTNLNNPQVNSIQGRVITTQVSQSIEITVNTGVDNSGGGAGFGNFNNGLLPQVTVRFTPDTIKTWNPSVYPDLTRFPITSTDGVLSTTFTYNAIGEYVYKLQVINQSNIISPIGGDAFLQIK